MWSRVLRSTAVPAIRLVTSSHNTGKPWASCRTLFAAAGVTSVATGCIVGSRPIGCEAPVDWNAVRKEVLKLLEDDKYKDSSYDGATPGPLLIRLAWHSAGTFCKATKTGGSDGATMRFEPEISWGANAGLAYAQSLLEPIKKQFPQVSYSDLWIFAAGVAIEEMGGPVIPFVPGRTDKASGKACPVWEGATHKDGRLPGADAGSPDKTAAHLRYIFHRMGFDDREIVALSGAHGLGACHTDRSGYWGPWTRAPTTVSNEYFRELLENTWTVKKTHKGKPWKGPMQFEDPTGELMMLPSDIVLIQDKAFRQYVELYAKDSDVFMKDFGAVVGKLFNSGFKG
jgi:cytochrome c peroxidase